MVSDWIQNKYLDKRIPYNSWYKEKNGHIVARILTHKYGGEVFYTGFVCSYNSFDFFDSIYSIHDDSLELVKLKIDIKLSDMGIKIRLPGA